jgi:hypothetical protein
VLAVAATAGCAATPRGDHNLLDFLDGQGVTRTQVLGRLGPDYATYEHARVLAYRIATGPAGYYVAPRRSDWKGVDYDLILVFDAQAVLEQHRLVPIRSAARAH